MTVAKKTLHELIDRIEDDELIMLYVKLLKREVEKSSEKPFFKTTREDMVLRAEMSEQDIAAGRTISVKQFQEDVENWKRERNLNTK